MKALFIGGTGNISTAVSRLARQQGVDLYLLNRGNRGDCGIPGAKSLVADIADRSGMEKALAGHSWDVVVNWIAFEEADVLRDMELLAGKTKHYIFISSASVYQKPPATPFITEETPRVNPFWDYSQKKIDCEELLLRMYREKGFPVTIVRPSLTYDTVIPVAIGGWNDYTAIDRIKRGGRMIIHGDGTSLWTITHAEDFARGFLGLMGNPKSIGEAFHITSDEILTWNQIYQAVADAAGAELKAVHIPTDFIVKVGRECGWGWMEGNLWGDKSHSAIFDNTKIKQFVPGFKAAIPFAEGIRRTVKWMESNPSRMNIVAGQNEFMDRVIKTYCGG